MVLKCERNRIRVNQTFELRLLYLLITSSWTHLSNIQTQHRIRGVKHLVLFTPAKRSPASCNCLDFSDNASEKVNQEQTFESHSGQINGYTDWLLKGCSTAQRIFHRQLRLPSAFLPCKIHEDHATQRKHSVLLLAELPRNPRNPRYRNSITTMAFRKTLCF